jgi:multicomponent Na+:H+ antiporter subunit B
MEKHSELFAQTMGVVYPLTLIFGIYIIYNGHISPGGGFQGGAILAGVFIIQYLTTGNQNVSLYLLNRIEKTIYLLLLVVGILLVLYLNQDLTIPQKQIYLIIMNSLIGVKVACGLTVIFFRFILFESR